MKVALKKPSSKYRDLTPGNVYRVIGIEADDFRLMNDAGRPFLYPSSIFIIVDPSEPRDWKTGQGPDGERYSYPPNSPGPASSKTISTTTAKPWPSSTLT